MLFYATRKSRSYSQMVFLIIPSSKSYNVILHTGRREASLPEIPLRRK